MGMIIIGGSLLVLVALVYFLTGGGSGISVAAPADRRPGEADRSPAERGPASLELEERFERRITGKQAADSLPDPSLVTQNVAPAPKDVRTMESILETTPDDVELIGIVAHQYLESRRLDDALRLYQRALELRPGDSTFLFYQGNCFYLKGLVSRACENWRRVISSDPSGKLGKKSADRLKKAGFRADSE